MNFKQVKIIIFFSVANMCQLYSQDIESSNALNQYSFNLYSETKVEKENLFLSPLSTYYALLSAYEGSKNKTKAELEKVLYLKDSTLSNSDYLHKFTSKTDSLSGLRISNAIWTEKKFQVEAAFKNVVSTKYASDVKQTDFENIKLAVSDINQWVAYKTNKRITKMVSPSDIHSKTKLMLTNAVSFKGEWLNKFEKARTCSATFFMDDDHQFEIDFLNIIEKINYFENEAFQFLSKPYKDSELSFCVILPKELYGLETIEKSLNANFFTEILDKTSVKEVWLSIPKIKMKSTYKLKDALVSLGLESMFSSEADFSGITKKEPLWFEQVLHKTYIDLNEEQTEAAAATTITTYITGQPSYKTVKANHPFLFFIIDDKTKDLVFMGRFFKPKNGKMIDKADFAGNLEKREIKRLGWNSGKVPLLLLVDGKKLKQVTIDDINFDDVDDLKVYTEKKDIEKYTTEDYYGVGVIVITLKKNREIKK